MRWIKWCSLCHKREVNGRSEHCAQCQADIQRAIEWLEEQANGE
jgi:hypothetical protein